MAEFVIAVVGNPNSGKTTLFNALTGSNQSVGNWPGVTVERKEGVFTVGEDTVRLVDLPGIYALAATSEDERVALEYVVNERVDLVVDVVDATNLERNLYLTTQLAEMELPMIIVMNMMDIAKGRGIDIDEEKLSKRIGCPVYSISAIRHDFIPELKKQILEQVKAKPRAHVDISYPEDIQLLVKAATEGFKKMEDKVNASAAWLALRVVEKTSYIIKLAKDNGCETAYELAGGSDKPEVVIAESRYRFSKDTVQHVTNSFGVAETFSDKVDKVVLHRIFGIPIFLFAMYMTFWVTLSIGGAFIDFFDQAFGAIFVDGASVLYDKIGLPGWLNALLSNGIGDGIKTVSTFVPIVFVMFVCLAILEDSGYMSRAAFVMDRFMRQIGLPGKSFVPMLVGFGCTVPAIMASRTLESSRDRILTVFMTPFMSCGARLPVYALFGAAFFGAKAGMMVFSLYVVGGILAVFTGLLLKNTMFKGEPSYFVMELPPYHFPIFKNIFQSAWGRLKSFIIRAGKVIIVSVALLGFFNSLGTDGSFGHRDAESSVLSKIGMTITPILEPMGVEKDNWPATVALFTGLFAKESIIGTLNSLYSQTIELEESPEGVEEDEESFQLLGSLKDAFATIPENLMGVAGGLLDPLGLSLLSEDEESTAASIGADSGIYQNLRTKFNQGPLQAYCYLLFILLYIPCVAAVSAIVREIGGKLAVVVAAYLLVLGWVTSTLVYQIGIGKNFFWIVTAGAVMLCMIFGLRMLGKSNIVSSRY